MTNSGKFMIAIVSAVGLVTLVGFLGYRKVSGESKSISKGGKKKVDDRTPVELGKTENVDNTEVVLDPVLVVSKKEINQTFKAIILNMLEKRKERYKEVLTLGDFFTEFTLKISSGFMFNKDVVKALPSSEDELVKLLVKIKMKRRVDIFLLANRQDKIFASTTEVKKGKTGAEKREFRPIKGYAIDLSEDNEFTTTHLGGGEKKKEAINFRLK